MIEICIGIDQSYQCTGISIFVNNKKKMMKSIDLKKLKCNTDKRIVLKKELESLIDHIYNIYNNNINITVLIERIRLRSDGFINIDYIKSIGALDSIIIDCCTQKGIKVYSVDTRAWKSQIVGTSKPKENKYGIDPKKWPTILWCIKSGWESNIKEDVGKQKKKGVIEKNGERFTYNDNVADSAGIALYWFNGNKNILKEEK